MNLLISPGNSAYVALCISKLLIGAKQFRILFSWYRAHRNVVTFLALIMFCALKLCHLPHSFLLVNTCLLYLSIHLFFNFSIRSHVLVVFPGKSLRLDFVLLSNLFIFQLYSFLLEFSLFTFIVTNDLCRFISAILF